MAHIRKKLERQISRHLKDNEGFWARMTNPSAEFIDEYPAESRNLIAGLPEFLSAIEESYAQYEDKNKMALRNLELSSQELNAANRQLDSLNQSIKAMLESLNLALLFFNREGICSPVFSKFCLDLLETDPSGKPIWEVLGQKEDKIETIKSLISFAFSNRSAMSFDDIFMMAPRFFEHSRHKIITLNYRPIYSLEKKLVGILVTAEDKTSEEKTKQLLAQKERHVEKILRLVNSKNDYIQLLMRIRDYFLSGDASLYIKETAAINILYELHTLKGNMGSFLMDDLVKIIHTIESRALYHTKTIEEVQAQITDLMPDIARAVYEEEKLAKQLFGEEVIHQGNVKTIEYRELVEFYSLLLKNKNAGDADRKVAEEFYEKFLAIPIFDALKFFDDQVQQSAILLDKEVYPCRFEGDNILIPTPAYHSVFASFILIARNAVDHGIEKPADRIALGKAAKAQISVAVSVTEEENQKWINISICDDGSGINKELIKQRLEKSGMVTAQFSDQELIKAVFLPEFSIKETVNTISGRGLGLSAVKKEIEKLGGQISVTTIETKQTCFLIKIPFIPILDLAL
jgi:two-component system chemotaxis sensor kinase CheA